MFRDESKPKKIKKILQERSRCPYDNYLLDKNGICWMCGYDENEDIREEMSFDSKKTR